jgi:hypothetical protein
MESITQDSTKDDGLAVNSCLLTFSPPRSSNRPEVEAENMITHALETYTNVSRTTSGKDHVGSTRWSCRQAWALWTSSRDF